MRGSVEAFTVAPDATILEAIKGIDRNKKGFLVVIDGEKAIGTITDGDIRRAFIRGASVEDGIGEVFTRHFRHLTQGDGVMAAVELFKDHSIKFLPILDGQGKLTNIITKDQVNTLLLQDIRADLGFDFMELDEIALNDQAYQRPWGFYKTTVLNDYFQSKVISVNPGQSLSLQSHARREEHWIVAHGTGTVQVDEKVIAVSRGSALYIPKGAKHRLANTGEKESLIVVEVQIGDYFGEDDIIRYEDTYGRT